MSGIIHRFHIELKLWGFSLFYGHFFVWTKYDKQIPHKIINIG